MIYLRMTISPRMDNEEIVVKKLFLLVMLAALLASAVITAAALTRAGPPGGQSTTQISLNQIDTGTQMVMASPIAIPTLIASAAAAAPTDSGMLPPIVGPPFATSFSLRHEGTFQIYNYDNTKTAPNTLEMVTTTAPSCPQIC